MRTVLLEPPAEVRAWLARRRELGQDLYDEVWEGEYHVAPAPHPAHPAHGDLDDQLALLLGPRARHAGLRGSGPLNVGEPDDYRVPDRAYLRARPTTAFVPTAALVVEIVSPGDETWAKPGFYFAHGVEELLVIDPVRRSVDLLCRGPSALVPAERSALLDLSAADLAAELDWPPR